MLPPLKNVHSHQSAGTAAQSGTLSGMLSYKCVCFIPDRVYILTLKQFNYA